MAARSIYEIARSVSSMCAECEDTPSLAPVCCKMGGGRGRANVTIFLDCCTEKEMY